jgi:hypothetical protein
MFAANIGEELAKRTAGIPTLPDDLEAWVESV